MLAGAIAGSVEHLAMYPVDTIKTHMQAQSTSTQAHALGRKPHMLRAAKSILRREGLRGLYRGIGPVAASAGPAHAVYFSAYEAAKSSLGRYAPNNSPLVPAAAGAVATIAADSMMTPADVIKQRLQLASSSYKGVMNCILRLASEEGIGVFFKSLPTTLVMNIPYTAVYFSSYETAKALLASSSAPSIPTTSFLNPGSGDEESPLVHMSAGGVAGGLAALMTTPLDVVKTRLQTEGLHRALGKDVKVQAPLSSRNIAAVASNGRSFGTTAALHSASQETAGVASSFAKIVSEPMNMVSSMVRQEGWGALFKGWRPRVWFHVPSAAICWTTYEGCKSFLANNEHCL
mmetsp:Transcript_9975/g.36460  ORF Transcript_9975/g.36460 Transcript_9975/m.36460 type:complete len:346 (-) Transcript_9975:90-1127(-)